MTPACRADACRQGRIDCPCPEECYMPERDAMSLLDQALVLCAYAGSVLISLTLIALAYLYITE